MALRSVLGVWLCGTGEDAATVVPGSSAVPGRTHSRPTTSQPAALPRSPVRVRKVLGNVPAVAAEASRPYVQDRCTEVERRRRCTAANSNRRSQRCRVVRGSGLLPDASRRRRGAALGSLQLAADARKRPTRRMVLELERRGDEEGGQRLRLGERVPFREDFRWVFARNSPTGTHAMRPSRQTTTGASWSACFRMASRAAKRNASSIRRPSAKIWPIRIPCLSFMPCLPSDASPENAQEPTQG